MYPEYQITDEQILAILSIQENYLNDVKAKEIKPSKLSDTVSAFGNSAGGDIYVGVAEDKILKTKSWIGYDNVEDANSTIHALLQSNTFDHHLKFEYLHNPNYPGKVLHITVFKVKDLVKATDGQIYVRENAGKLPVDTQEKLEKLKRDKGITTFEEELVQVPVRYIENSKSIINFILNVVPTAEPITYLNNQQLVFDDKAKVSAVLLFADEPAIFLPKRCSVKILRYKTKQEAISREYLDSQPITLEGSLYELIYATVSKVTEIVESVSKLGPNGFEKVSYPQITLHEIITNAVLHRDYAIAADIQIRIYDNRVEVQSPGRLVGHVTPYNILETQCARNPQVVRLISKFPDAPNKDAGEGLNVAFEAMKSLQLKEPTVDEKDDSVLVVIRHEALGSPEEIVMKYLEGNSDITNSIARDLTGIKDANQMKDVFLRLKKSNMIEQVPEKRSSKSAWRKT